MDPSFVLRSLRENPIDDRPVVQASLGCHVEGLLQPHVDPSDTVTAAAGAMFRFCRDIPHKRRKRKIFRQFVQKWLVDNITPLEPDTDCSFENWIKATPYTQKRKNELSEKWERITTDLKNLESKFLVVKSFVKDESYPTAKHARAINSRTDEFKCAVGPIFKLISDRLFSLKWFIKKIPIHERPDYIMDTCYKLGAEYVTSDYTSFEAHFDPETMEDCEMQLVYHMVKFIPQGQQFIHLLRRAKMNNPNLIFFKNFSISIKGKRMSGEMDTSTSNGFSNLMFMLYLCQSNGNTDVRGVIEGDDGLFVMQGPQLDPKIFDDFGLTIKMVKFNEINHASFCGMVFDLEDRTNVTDPISELVNFGWTSARYARSKRHVHLSLIRAKALSLAYQYPACPILTAYANKMCELTAGIDIVNWIEKQGGHAFNLYEMEIIRATQQYMTKNQLNRAPGIKTRLLVEDLYGISVSDQIKIEKEIGEITEIRPFVSSTVLLYAPKIWSDHYERYTVLTSDKQPDFLGFKWPEVRPKADLL